MKDKLSKPDKMTEALDSLDQYINNLIKKHDQEMQSVVEEKDKLEAKVKKLQELKKNECNASLVKANARLETKVKQLEQQIKKKNDYIREILILNVELENRFRDKELEESREVSVEELKEGYLMWLAYEVCPNAREDCYENCGSCLEIVDEVATAIYNLINGDKQ